MNFVFDSVVLEAQVPAELVAAATEDGDAGDGVVAGEVLGVADGGGGWALARPGDGELRGLALVVACGAARGRRAGDEGNCNAAMAVTAWTPLGATASNGNVRVLRDKIGQGLLMSAAGGVGALGVTLVVRVVAGQPRSVHREHLDCWLSCC